MRLAACAPDLHGLAGPLAGRRLIAAGNPGIPEPPMAQKEDQEQDWRPLLERVLEGEDLAERDLVRQLWPLVAGRLAALCPRRDEIEDLAQEVFLKVFRGLPGYRGGKFEAWVDVLTRRVCYDALRKQRVRPEWRFADLDHFDESLIEEGGSVTPSEFGEDCQVLLVTLFRRLPSQQVWLLNEVELKERSIGEVSREMGWTEVAGRLRLMRARRRLEKEYRKLESER